MHNFIIQAMVHDLGPAIKSRRKAEHILETFWRDKIALVWDVEDVYTAANERDLALTKEEAIKVLQDLHANHDKQLGLRWSDLTSYVEEYGLGRKLTKRELKRFVDKDILTIQRQ